MVDRTKRPKGDRLITVLTKSNCQQCMATKRFLDKHGIAYTARDVEHDPEALAIARNLGHTSAPVVITDTAHWSGFRNDKLKTLIPKDNN